MWIPRPTGTATAVGGRWELIIDGDPPEPVTTPDGSDYVYGWVAN